MAAKQPAKMPMTPKKGMAKDTTKMKMDGKMNMKGNKSC